MIYLCFQLRHFFIHKYFMAYMANIKTLSVFSVNDFLDRKILDKCLIASVLLLNGKNSWQTHCMEFCRGQIRERNVIRLGRAGIGRDRAYFSSFVLRSVTVSSRISLSFNLVSRLILHRLQGPGGHTQLDWNICNVYFCFHPKRTNVLQSKLSSSMLLIATSNHPFSCGLVSIKRHPLQSVNICPHLLPFIILHRHHCIHLQQPPYNQYQHYFLHL